MRTGIGAAYSGNKGEMNAVRQYNKDNYKIVKDAIRIA